MAGLRWIFDLWSPILNASNAFPLSFACCSKIGLISDKTPVRSNGSNPPYFQKNRVVFQNLSPLAAVAALLRRIEFSSSCYGISFRSEPTAVTYPLPGDIPFFPSHRESIHLQGVSVPEKFGHNRADNLFSFILIRPLPQPRHVNSGTVAEVVNFRCGQRHREN